MAMEVIKREVPDQSSDLIFMCFSPFFPLFCFFGSSSEKKYWRRLDIHTCLLCGIACILNDHTVLVKIWMMMLWYFALFFAVSSFGKLVSLLAYLALCGRRSPWNIKRNNLLWQNEKHSLWQQIRRGKGGWKETKVSLNFVYS